MDAIVFLWFLCATEHFGSAGRRSKKVEGGE